MDNFYVYLYIRENSTKHGLAGTPYYVGKGKGMRAFNRHHRVRTPSNLAMIVFVAQNLSESAAHALEKEQIAKYGRLDNGTGCLANLTDGGEGQCGRVQSKEERRRKSEWMKAHPNRGNILLKATCHTPEARAKASASNRGRKRSESYCKTRSEKLKGTVPKCAGWNAGIPRTEEQKKRHSELMSGRKQSAEAVAKRAMANRESSLKMFGCTGIERRRMRRRERYAELQAEGRGYQRKRV